MLKSKFIRSRKPSVWDDHNKRVADVEAQGRELENLFPHKFKHPRIGRQYMMDREDGLFLKGFTVSPGIEIYKVGRDREPSKARQFWLGVLIILAFFGACYALP